MKSEKGRNRKDILIKKAIREVAKEYGIGHDSYHKVTTRMIYDYMFDNNMGRRWISKIQIITIRSNLPNMYREMFE